MICIYDSKESNFNNNGLVVLNDTISCNIIEELNGQYELELEYPIDERGKWQYLVEENIVKAEGQLFRIYHKIKTLTSIKINARHIFYDLLDNFLEDVRPTNLNGSGALDWILNNTQYPHRFASISDVQTVATKYFVRKNVVEAIMGQDGIIDNWGGELVRDNFTIKLLQARGADRGVLVAYGKNIVGIEETLDIDDICTRLMPVGKDWLLLPEKYIDSPYINNFSHPKIRVQEFSDIGIDEENGITEEIAITQLRQVAQEYMLNNKIDIPQFNYKIDFIELSKTEEYKNYAVLERVYLGDTVTIKHSKLGINLKAKVIKIKKNVLTDRIEEIELGSFKPNLANSIANSIQSVKQEIVNTKSSLQDAIEYATQQINSALGGYVLKRNGELLIMDTEDINTAKNVWRWNLNGLGFSSTGYNGEFKTAITADGHFVADFIDVGTLKAELIKTGILKSKNNTWQLNLDGGTFNLGNKLMFDGDNLTFGSGVTLSWNQITNQPSIPNDSYITQIAENTISTTTVIAQNLQVKSANILGTLTADKIQGNSITTDKLYIGDFTNLCPNPSFMDGTAAEWSGVSATNTGMPSGAPTTYVGKQSARDGHCGDWFPVNEGDKFYVEVQCATPNSTKNFGIGLHLKMEDGTNTWPVCATTPSSAWKTLSGVITVPAGYTKAKVFTQINAFDTFGDWYFTKVIVRRMIGTALIDTIAVDKLTTATANPIIKLFDNINGGSPAIDATYNNNQGWGSSIRLKWNDSNYIYLDSSSIKFYQGGNAIHFFDTAAANLNGMYIGRTNEIYNGSNVVWINYRGGSGLKVGNGAANGSYGPIYGSTKNAVTYIENYGSVVTYADESPNHVFNDAGHGVIGDDGLCYIYLDPIFLETVNTKLADYLVFLTGYEGSNVEIKEKQPDYFVVSGTPNKEFDWLIRAERKGMERLRWNDADIVI